MSERDLAFAEELVAVLTPLKIATTALCEESVPTLSMTYPCFKSTPFLNDKDIFDAYHEVTVLAVFALSSVNSKAAVKANAAEVTQSEATPEHPALPTLPDECHDDLSTVLLRK